MTPAYLPVQPGTGKVYGPNNRLISTAPDWNNEAFLSRWEALMAELGKRYANDPRLGYVDVGGYGKYGEWWVDGAAVHITDANGLRMIKAVTTAFPTKHVLLNTMSAGRLHDGGHQRQPEPGHPHRLAGLPEHVLDGHRPRRHPPEPGVEDPPVLQRVVHHRRPGGRSGDRSPRGTCRRPRATTCG